MNGARYLQLVGVSNYGHYCRTSDMEVAERYVRVDTMAVNAWLFQSGGPIRSC